MPDPLWAIRRIQRADGTTLKVPLFWGHVHASSASVAVRRFLEISRAEESASHFTAVAFRGRP